MQRRWSFRVVFVAGGYGSCSGERDQLSVGQVPRFYTVMQFVRRARFAKASAMLATEERLPDLLAGRRRAWAAGMVRV